jgi:hypothetical protein
MKTLLKLDAKVTNSFLAGKLGLEYLNVLQFGTRAGDRPWCDRALLLLAAQVGWRSFCDWKND